MLHDASGSLARVVSQYPLLAANAWPAAIMDEATLVPRLVGYPVLPVLTNVDDSSLTEPWQMRPFIPELGK